MTSNQLELFLVVADSGSYKKAGETLHVSHSAIHRQIRLLEEDLHERLFSRLGKHIQLTETGKVLVDHARQIRRQLDHARNAVQEMTELRRGSLKFGTATALLADFIPTALEVFRRTYPNIHIKGRTGIAEDLIKEVASGKLDLGIVVLPMEAPRLFQGVKYEFLFREEFVLAVAKDHPMATKRNVRMDQLQDCQFILYSTDSYLRRFLDNILFQAGVTPAVSMELENEMFIEKMIEIDMGVAFLPKRRVIHDRFRYTRIRDCAIFLDVGFVFPICDYMPRPVQEFVRMCRDASREFQ